MRITFIQEGSKYQHHEFMHQLPIVEAAFPAANITVLRNDEHDITCELAAKASEEADYLVAVGNDRTLHNVINGSLRRGESRPEATLPVFCALPVGTNSDFIHALDVKGDVQELCRLINEGMSRPVDVGRLRYQNATGGAEERYFINVTDVGIGASVLKHMVTGGKFLGGNLHYLESILVSLFEYRKVELHIETDAGFSWQGRTLAVIATNSGYHSDGLRLATDALLDDGQLSVTIVRDASAVDFLCNLHSIGTAANQQHENVEYHKAGWLRVSATSGLAPVQADGEFLGSTPLELDVLQKKIRFLAPAVANTEISAAE